MINNSNNHCNNNRNNHGNNNSNSNTIYNAYILTYVYIYIHVTHNPKNYDMSCPFFQVIFARADSEFRTVEDLRRAHVEAVSISGLGAMQLQQADSWSLAML